VVEEDAEPTRPVGAHPTTDNGAGQGDRLAVLLLQASKPGRYRRASSRER
jgi:hypothetical protein